MSKILNKSDSSFISTHIACYAQTSQNDIERRNKEHIKEVNCGKKKSNKQARIKTKRQKIRNEKKINKQTNELQYHKNKIQHTITSLKRKPQPMDSEEQRTTL